MNQKARCRIICIGNRYVPGDDLGTKVYDLLKQRRLPPGVELIEGGLAGLDLLPAIEGVDRVLFVDAVCGFPTDSGIVILDRDSLLAEAPLHFGHSAGVPYLVHALPIVNDGPLPELFLLGAEPGADDQTVDSLANACFHMAAGR